MSREYPPRGRWRVTAGPGSLCACDTNLLTFHPAAAAGPKKSSSMPGSRKAVRMCRFATRQRAGPRRRASGWRHSSGPRPPRP